MRSESSSRCSFCVARGVSFVLDDFVFSSFLFEEEDFSVCVSSLDDAVSSEGVSSDFDLSSRDYDSSEEVSSDWGVSDICLAVSAWT